MDRAQRLVTSTTDDPYSTIDSVSVAYNGLLQSTKNAQGHISRTYYDAYGRVTKQTDPRTDPDPTPLRIGYYASGTGQTGQVQWREDSAGKRTNYAYYATDGRLFSITDPLNKTTRHLYNLRGQNNAQWGAATYPVGRVFNDYGELYQQQTFRNGTGWDGATWPFTAHGGADVTTWDHDPASGVLKSKTDADNKSVLYTYNVRGQLATRTWARGVITTYRYFGDGSGQATEPKTAEQRAIEYSDTTPNLGYAYNRLGQNTQVADLTGTRLIDHCVCGKVTGETFDTYFGGRKITYSLSGLASGVAGRTTRVELSGANAAGGEYAVNYGYDAYGRFYQVADGGGFAFTYNFATPNSNLVSSLTQTSGGPAQTMNTAFAYEANRDLLASITATYASASKAAFAYGHDALGRRTSVVQSGEIFSRYQNGGLMTRWSYNDRSEVIGSQSYYGDNINDLTQPVAARQLTYAFDNIGSRTTTSVDGVTTTYANNALNQVTSRIEPASSWITGLAPTAATVSINGTSAGVTRQGEYYAKNVTVGTRPLWQNFTVASTLSPSPAGDYVRGRLFAASPEAYTYDLDGNLTSDGAWTYTWDAENRLTSMYPLTAIESMLPAASRKRINFHYDYLGRRVRKTVQTWNGSAYVTSVDRKFIYDGWNLLTERDATTLSVVANYVWGLDLSKTLQDGGGVGGLLAVLEPNGTTHLTAHDGNGNVAALINKTTGAITAAYEYDAFGQTIRATGAMSASNPFRFSTKYTDAETGLLYYGRRYYDPKTGRWLSRDPAEELGGLHLYGFVGNNGVNKWDFLGMWGSDGTGGDDPWSGFGGGESSWVSALTGRDSSNTFWETHTVALNGRNAPLGATTDDPTGGRSSPGDPTSRDLVGLLSDGLSALFSPDSASRADSSNRSESISAKAIAAIRKEMGEKLNQGVIRPLSGPEADEIVKLKEAFATYSDTELVKVARELVVRVFYIDSSISGPETMSKTSTTFGYTYPDIYSNTIFLNPDLFSGTLRIPDASGKPTWIYNVGETVIHENVHLRLEAQGVKDPGGVKAHRIMNEYQQSIIDAILREALRGR